ncbi:hypothetical protein ILP97_10955 [Amycolatopsis sp. H6(2020)]|nr:hypothetical protein [Amycolatopsis sp. H6(2020)]
MNDQPREQKAPDGAEQPTVEHPTAPPTAASETSGAPAGEPATPATPAPATGAAAEPEPGRPAASPTPAAADPAASGATPAAAQAAADPAASGATPADQTAVHGQQPPPTPPPGPPGPGQPYAAWGPPQAAPRQGGGFRRFVGHRATQLVAVGVLGMLVGAGIVGGIAAGSHHGPRDGRPGVHRQYDGPNQGFDGRGPGFGGRGNAGSGSGDGI